MSGHVGLPPRLSWRCLQVFGSHIDGSEMAGLAGDPAGEICMQPVVAIDAHKASCTYVVRHWDENQAGPTRIPSTKTALTRLARSYPGHDFVLEASGVHEWMMDLLRELGIEVKAVVAPKKSSKGKKSDGEDAIRLAKKHQAGELREVYVAPPRLRQLRDQVHQYAFLKAKRVAFNNHLKQTLNRWDFTIEKPKGKPATIYSQAGRKQVLQRFPHLQVLYDAIDAMDAGLKEMENHLEKTAKSIAEVEILTSIKGVATAIALALHVEIGDIHRFHNAEALVSYFGLDPVHGGSGDKHWDAHRISKKGNAHVRGLLTQGAWAHVTHCPESDISCKYDQTVAKGVDKQKAIVMVERKLVKAIYWMLKQEREFMMTGPAVT